MRARCRRRCCRCQPSPGACAAHLSFFGAHAEQVRLQYRGANLLFAALHGCPHAPAESTAVRRKLYVQKHVSQRLVLASQRVKALHQRVGAHRDGGPATPSSGAPSLPMGPSAVRSRDSAVPWNTGRSWGSGASGRAPTSVPSEERRASRGRRSPDSSRGPTAPAGPGDRRPPPEARSPPPGLRGCARTEHRRCPGPAGAGHHHREPEVGGLRPIEAGAHGVSDVHRVSRPSARGPRPPGPWGAPPAPTGPASPGRSPAKYASSPTALTWVYWPT